jgi:hypothetical protein
MNTENIESSGKAIHNSGNSRSSRRVFLGKLSSLAATGVAAEVVGLGSIPAQARLVDDADHPRERTEESYRIREQAARKEQGLGTPPELTNGDEGRYVNFIGNYSKGLPHNAIGEVELGTYQTYLAAIRTGTTAAFELVPLGGTTKLVNPVAGVAFDLEGTDSHQFSIPPAPSVASQVRSDEMVELYWMALCRDVNFVDYASDPTARAAITELSSLGSFQGPKAGGSITEQTLFRGFTPGDAIGPYVSQLFLTPFSYGQFTLSGQVSTYLPGTDYLTTQPGWMACQNGEGPFAVDQIDPQFRYYRNGRDIAAYVHVDHICEAFYNAALRLYQAGAPPNPGNPYTKLKKQSPFGTFGEPHFLTMHGEFALRALKAVWYAKWFVHRTLRPEAFGGLVHMTKTRQANYPLHPDVLNSTALGKTFEKFGTYFLSSAFPEGCPQHPSYAQAHGAVAGACATFLKAAFDGSVQFTSLKNGEIQVASEDGLSLLSYLGSDANQITVGGEINKLASNIGIARNFAGVHWRSDYTEGLRLGETVAISILRDQHKVYAGEDFAGFQITTFDGTSHIV